MRRSPPAMFSVPGADELSLGKRARFIDRSLPNLTKSATSAKMTFMGQKDSPPPRPPRTEVFISAASADLKGARARVRRAACGVRRAVNTIRCHGVYQEEFPPDYRRVEEMLRSLIEECDAVIHIAGVCYGSEPKNRPSDKPRRSYTQMEYDIAQELGRPLYVFVCAETFPYDPHSPEADDAAALQKAHREACLGRAEFRETVATTGELEKRVSQLHEHLRRLERQILETSGAIKVVREQVDEVQSLRRGCHIFLTSRSTRSWTYCKSTRNPCADFGCSSFGRHGNFGAAALPVPNRRSWSWRFKIHLPKLRTRKPGYAGSTAGAKHGKPLRPDTTVSASKISLRFLFCKTWGIAGESSTLLKVTLLNRMYCQRAMNQFALGCIHQIRSRSFLPMITYATLFAT